MYYHQSEIIVLVKSVKKICIFNGGSKEKTLGMCASSQSILFNFMKFAGKKWPK